MRRTLVLVGMLLLVAGAIVWRVRPCLLPGGPYTCRQYDCVRAADGLWQEAVTKQDTAQAVAYRFTCSR